MSTQREQPSDKQPPVPTYVPEPPDPNDWREIPGIPGEPDLEEPEEEERMKTTLPTRETPGE